MSVKHYVSVGVCRRNTTVSTGSNRETAALNYFFLLGFILRRNDI